MSKRTIGFILAIFMLFSMPLAAQANRKLAVTLTKKGHKVNDNSLKEIKLYLKAIDADKSYYKPYYNLGNIFFDQKKYDKAIFYFKKASKLNENDTDVLYNMALSFYLQKKQVEATRTLQKLLKTNPKDYEAMYLIAKLYLKTQSHTSKNAARLLLIKIQNLSKSKELIIKARKTLSKIQNIRKK